jgi:hypothetical protein
MRLIAALVSAVVPEFDLPLFRVRKRHCARKSKYKLVEHGTVELQNVNPTIIVDACAAL